jgi:hypothetical protein
MMATRTQARRVLYFVNGEVYWLAWDDANRQSALRALWQWADNSELRFTEADAAVLEARIRQEARR